MSFGYGQQTPYDRTSTLGEISFIIRQMIARMNTMKLVKVLAVYNTGGVSTAGTVDVQPLVSQVDGNNNAQPHGTVSGIQYFRLQGGTNAIICDPVVGDVGYVICADRDSTSVKTQQNTPVTPGSSRRFDLQDGVYVGGVLNNTPKQYFQFTSSGIVIADSNGNQIQMNSSGITFVGQVNMGNVTLGASGSTLGINGSIHVTATVTGDTDVVGGGKSLKTHIHSGVTTGAGVTGPPV